MTNYIKKISFLGYNTFFRWRERPARATLPVIKIIVVTSETLAIATTMKINLNFNSQDLNNPACPIPKFRNR